jgi:hypothetical protein
MHHHAHVVVRCQTAVCCQEGHFWSSFVLARQFGDACFIACPSIAATVLWDSWVQTSALRRKMLLVSRSPQFVAQLTSLACRQRKECMMLAMYKEFITSCGGSTEVPQGRQALVESSSADKPQPCLCHTLYWLLMVNHIVCVSHLLIDCYTTILSHLKCACMTSLNSGGGCFNKSTMAKRIVASLQENPTSTGYCAHRRQLVLVSPCTYLPMTRIAC